MRKIVVVALVTCTLLGIPLFNELSSLRTTLDESVEIVESEGYWISYNVKWNEIKATGIKLTEKSWKGFLQVCERLAVNFGYLQIYLDLEARVMFVYANPSDPQSDREAYYVQF
jgi:hypothetical protein